MAEQHQSWWKANKGAAHDELGAKLNFLAEQNREMRQDNLLYLNIQANWNVDGSGCLGPIYWRTNDRKIRRNVSAAALDTAASLIAANRTIPSYQTSNGNFTISRKAEQRARVIHAQMWQLGAFDLGVEAFYDGGCVGTGITHGCVDPGTGLPALIRVMPNSLFVDAAERDRPRSLYWVHFVSRDILVANYPNKRFDLRESAGPSYSDYEDYFIREDNRADLVKVIEAWHLPSRPGAKDGRHVIATSNCTLIDEAHTRDRFPFAFYHYAKRRAGFFGQGLIERTLPAQLRICELQKVVDRCQDLASNAVWLVEENSNVEADDITNLEGQVLTYQGAAPQMVVWQGTPMDIKAEIAEIAANVFEQEGLSPGMIGGELPQKGLGSARAVRAADDVASRRQVIPTRALESYYLQIARLIEDLNDDVLADDPDYQVKGYTRAGRQQFITSSKWADLEMPEGDATLTVMSMSAMPTTPQGRMSAVEEYIAGGFMSKPTALSLMEFPDVSAWASLETAALDLTEWQIERILDGHPELPIPQQDIALAKDLMQKAYLISYRMQAPPEVLDRFENFLAYADQLEEEMAAEAAAKAPPADPAMGGMGPGAAPIDPSTVPMAPLAA